MMASSLDELQRQEHQVSEEKEEDNHSPSSSDQVTDDNEDDVLTSEDERVKDVREQAYYLPFLGRLMKDFPKIVLPRLEEVARENFLLRDDEEAMERLTEELQQEAKGYRLHTYVPHLNPDPRVEEQAQIAIEHFHQMLRVPASLEGLAEIEDSIESVIVIDHRELQMLFEAKKKAFKAQGRPDTEVMMFHGTEWNNEDSIMTNNFDLSKGKRKVFGEGIYLSELPSVSLGYGTCLFLCRVLPGLVQTRGKIFDPRRFDSFFHRQQQENDEGKGNYVIKESDQILPFCVVRVRVSFYKKMLQHVETRSSNSVASLLGNQMRRGWFCTIL